MISTVTISTVARKNGLPVNVDHGPQSGLFSLPNVLDRFRPVGSHGFADGHHAGEIELVLGQQARQFLAGGEHVGGRILALRR